MRDHGGSLDQKRSWGVQGIARACEQVFLGMCLCVGNTRYDRQAGSGAIHVYVCDDSVRHDSQTGGGASLGRVFVTTVYNATGNREWGY